MVSILLMHAADARSVSTELFFLLKSTNQKDFLRAYPSDWASSVWRFEPHNCLKDLKIETNSVPTEKILEKFQNQSRWKISSKFTAFD